MFKLTWKISIENYQLKMIESVIVKRSVEQLSDTAEIVLPATVFNRELKITDRIKPGDKVVIELGYNNRNRKEFEGYLTSISTDGGSLKLSCEDNLYSFRMAMKKKELKNVTLKQLLEECTQVVGKGFKLVCDYDFTYDSFVIDNQTAYDLLSKLQKETGAYIYLKDETLYVHAPYAKVFGKSTYDFSKNIDREDIDLVYKRAEDQKLQVTAEGKNAEGKNVKVIMGEAGGETETLTVGGVSSEKTLRRKAETFLESRVYSGYEGGFTGWLLPYCEPGYAIALKDPEHEFKNGTYYVTGVEIDFSQNGGKRKINLGKKMG